MCERGYWVVNSDDARILDAVANHARHHEMKLGHTTIPVDGVEMEPIEGVESAKYRTLSPIYVSYYTEDGEREDLLPSDGMWFNDLIDGVRGRMEAMDHDTPSKLVIEDINWWKNKRLRVAENGWVRCARLAADIRTDAQTSEFIQQQGLGERSGLGFGCVMPVDQIPAEWK